MANLLKGKKSRLRQFHHVADTLTSLTTSKKGGRIPKWLARTIQSKLSIEVKSLQQLLTEYLIDHTKNDKRIKRNSLRKIY